MLKKRVHICLAILLIASFLNQPLSLLQGNLSTPIFRGNSPISITEKPIKSSPIAKFYLAVDQIRAWLEGTGPARLNQASLIDFQDKLVALDAVLREFQISNAQIRWNEVDTLSIQVQAAGNQLNKLLASRSFQADLASGSAQFWPMLSSIANYQRTWLLLSRQLDGLKNSCITWEAAQNQVDKAKYWQEILASITALRATLAVNSLQDVEQPPADVQGGIAPAITEEIPIAAWPQILPNAAYQTQTSPPTPADLAATMEVQISEEIINLAASLDNSPVRIYEYVRNHFALEPYFGSMKGSTATLWSRAGNDYDQASLLLALLRAANIPSRYVIGQVTLPIQQVQDWVGVKDGYAAANVLWWPRTLYTSGGIPVRLQIEHAWVEAYVPYSDYGGDAPQSDGPAAGGKLWIPLDPSFKVKRYQPGLSLPTGLDFDRSGFLSSIHLYLPSETYTDQVRDYLIANQPGKALSDVAYSGDILPEELGYLPASLPYAVDSITSEFSEVPADTRHRIQVTLYEYSTNRVLIPTTWIYFPEAAQQRLTISYQPSGTSVQPFLKKDGAMLSSGASVTPGNYTYLVVDFYYPRSGLYQEIVDYRKAGDTLALVMDMHQVSERLLGERGSKLLEARKLVGTAQEDPEAVQGELLNLAGLRYFQNLERESLTIAGYYQAVINKYISYALLTGETQITYLFDRPFAMIPEGLNIDVGMRVRGYYNIYNDSSQIKEINRLEGMASSALEHQLWEEMVLDPSISTIKGLQYASQLGMPIYQIDQTNINTIMPLLTLTQGVKDSISNDVNAGYVVTVHRDPITYYQWNGAVWISEDPDDWNAGYWISGSVQGGGDACPGCPAPKNPGTTGDPLGMCNKGRQPVTFSNGNMFHQFLDVYIPAARGVGIALVRTYNSQSAENGPFGYGWTHNYIAYLTEDTITGNLTFTNDSGGKYVFVKSGAAYISPYGMNTTLTKTGAGYQMRSKDGVLGYFNTQGQWTSLVDVYGNTLTLTYSSGRLATVSDAVGRSLSFLYNASGKISALTDFFGRTWSYTYDGNGNLASSTIPFDAQTVAITTTYTYYTTAPFEHNLESIIDGRGYTTRFQYFGNDQIFQTNEPEGKNITYFYQPFRHETVVTADGLPPWVFRYNSEGFCERIKDPQQNYVTYDYDSRGNITETSDNQGYTTSFGYDERDNLIVLVDAQGNQTHYEYDPVFNQLTSRQDARGYRETIEIDPANGNMLSSTDATNYKTSYTYNSFGFLTSVTDPKNRIRTYQYDSYGFPLNVIDLGNKTWTFSFDSLGRMTSFQMPEYQPEQYGYDILGRLIWSRDLAGNLHSYQYDANHNLVAYTDPQGKETRYEYDGLNNLVRMLDIDQQVYTFTYQNRNCPACEAASNLVAWSTPSNNTWRIIYDVLDRPVREIDPNRSSRSFIYDAGGHLTKAINELGEITQFSYDAVGRQSGIIYPDGAQEAYSYDPVGNLLSAANAYTTVSYGYDPRGLVNQSHDSALNKTIQYGYDGVRNLATMIDDDGITWNFTYDANDNLISLKDFNNVTTQFTYNSINRLTLSTPATGSAGLRSSRAYDSAGRLSGVTQTSPNQITTFIQSTMTYDPISQVQQIQTSGMAAFAKLFGPTNYSYTDLQQLLQVAWSDGTIQKYVYDLAGNRTQLTQNTNSPVASYFDEADRMTFTDRDGGTTFTYDIRGNLQTKTSAGQTTTYTWNAKNELVWIDFPNGTHAAYTYDALGRRVRKILPDGTEIRYLYNGMNLMQEFNSSGSTRAKYVHAENLDQPISMQRGGQVYYYLRDYLGSVIGLTDGANTLKASYIYDPWGNQVDGNDGGIENPFRFTGREFDSESGFYYYRARYYDPQDGRFISRDPVGMSGGMNLYSYTANNPVNATDPYGLLTIPFTDININAGECVGLESAMWYANKWNETRNPIYYVGGVGASLWTPGTSDITTAVLTAPSAVKNIPQAIKSIPGLVKNIGSGLKGIGNAAVGAAKSVGEAAKGIQAAYTDYKLSKDAANIVKIFNEWGKSGEVSKGIAVLEDMVQPGNSSGNAILLKLPEQAAKMMNSAKNNVDFSISKSVWETTSKFAAIVKK